MATHLNLTFKHVEPPQWKRFIEEYPTQYQPDAISNRMVEMTPIRYRLMCAVQRDVNAVVRYKHDEAGNDYWKLVYDFPYEGDCEDFALTKRAMLLEAGFPYHSLWPTICTKHQKDHMVLIVHCDTYDLVLDNGISMPARSVNHVPYTWRAVFDGNVWRMVSPTKTSGH